MLFMLKAESILLKRGLRSDGIWTHPYMYKSFLKLIPLFFDTWALMRSQYWPRQRIERLIDERLKELTRGRDVTRELIAGFIERLDIPAAERARLLALTPALYTGQAVQLAQRIG